MPLNIGKII